MRRFWPYIGHHDGFTVTANGIFEQVGQLALPVGYVVPSLLWEGYHYLL